LRKTINSDVPIALGSILLSQFATKQRLRPLGWV